MNKNVAIAVVPAAGRGTRMAAARGAGAKELLPVGPYPMIQWALEEIAGAGIPRVAIVGSPAKPGIRDYVTRWKAGRDLRLTYVEQPRPEGLADALFKARAVVGARPFALLLPDNVFFPSKGRPGAMAQVLRGYAATGQSTCGLIRVRPKDAQTFSHAGLVELAGRPRGPVAITRLHPKRGGALSLKSAGPAYKTLARAVLTPQFYECLERYVEKRPDADEVSALQALARNGTLYGVLLKGRGFDAGIPAGYAAAARSWARRRRRRHPTK